jgi:glucose-6-phosphate 1-dehydrogenase
MLIMERPVSMHPDDIRDEKTKVLRSMRVLKPEDVVIAQYTAGNGKPGYLDHEGVPKDSKSPTYAVCGLMCDNERWEGVPMVIKAGKGMNESKTEVRVQFKTQHAGFFKDHGEGDDMRNEFVMELKPKDASVPLLICCNTTS